MSLVLSNRKRLTGLLLGIGLIAIALLAGCQGASESNPASTEASASTDDPLPGHYVASYGQDSAPGTKDQPWRTIQHAIDRTTGGGTIWVRGGTYRQSMVVTHSGTPDRYLTIRGYPGETAIIDGRGLAIDNGQAGLVTIRDQSYVRIRGLDIRHYRSTDTQVPIGIFVTGYGQHIELVDNRIHRIATTHRGCDGNALGVAVYGSEGYDALRDIVIAGNEIDHLTTGCSESVAINGNVDGFTIRDNHIHDNNNIGIDIIGFEGVSPNPATDIARNGRILGNTIHDISSAQNPAYAKGDYGAGGIYVDGGRDVVIERNRVYRADIGIELASEHPDRDTHHVIVRNNLVYRNRTAGLSIGGYSQRVGGTRDCTIVNNTLYANDSRHSGSGEFQIQYHARNNSFKNNLLIAGDQGLLINNAYGDTRGPAAIDYNLYDASGDSFYVWAGQTYDDVDSFRRASAIDNSGFEADARLASTDDTADFPLKADSPARNAGLTLDLAVLGHQDVVGKARVREGQVDIGANEY